MNKALQKKICMSITALLFAPFVFGTFFKGGIGMTSHLALFLGAGLTGLLFLYALRKKIYTYRPFPFFENVFLFFTVIFFSLSYSYSQTQNVGLLELGSLYSGFILVFIGYYLSHEKKHLNMLFSFFSLTALVSVIVGLYAYLNQPFERFAGSFNNFLEPWSAFPNAFGDFLILILPLTFYLIIYRPKSRKKETVLRFFPEVSFASSIMALYLTDSLGIHLTAILILGALLIRSLVNKKGVAELMMLTVIGVLLALGVSMLEAIGDYDDYREPVMISETMSLSGESFETRQSVNTRLDHYWIGSALFEAAPLFGFGPGSYPYVSSQYMSFLNTATHPHNLFLKIGIENGLTTMIAFVAFLLFAIGRSIYLFFHKLDPAREIVCISVCGFLLHQMIDYNLNFTSVAFLFYILVGVLITKRIRKVRPFNYPDLKVANHFLLVVCSGLLVVFALYQGGIRLQELRAGSHAEQFKVQSYSLVKRSFFEDYARYQMTEGIASSEVSKTLSHGLRMNPYNAELYALDGQFRSAYELNPHNLRYLLGMYESASPIRQAELKEEIESVLNEYLFLLSANTHFTILTDNPRSAFSLARAIGNDMLADEIERVTAHEQDKFSRLYDYEF